MATDRSARPAATPQRYDAVLANHIEAKWQKRWRERATYHTPNPIGDLAEPNAQLAQRPPYYVLDMFPYPSGSGLHVGHPLGYIGTDIFARYQRMRGYNVLHTMGYDAFGLPAERYAVETNQHPAVTTQRNIANMGAQLSRIGLGHDDRRTISTTDPDYYRWTQWIFLQIYHSWYDPEADAARPVADLEAALDAGERDLPPEAVSVAGGRAWSELSAKEQKRALDQVRLAYLDEVTVNWCPQLGTVLANEEVSSKGRSEQGNFPVYRRPLRQWMLRITAYADRLLADLDGLEWPESLKAMQRNWIGRSEGVEVEFDVDLPDVGSLSVFTTRPDTVHGVTFITVSPEHTLLSGRLPHAYPEGTPAAWRGADQGLPAAPVDGFANPSEACAAYRAETEGRTERARQVESDPSGVYTGVDAIHPLTRERVPIFVADYVLMAYGSGAVMGVPAHDSRDFRFARTFQLPVKVVVRPSAEWYAEHSLPLGAGGNEWPEAYTGTGTSVSADGPSDGRPIDEAGQILIDELARRAKGRRQLQYRLRDWLFSRQRYWGEPFPIVYDADGDPVALPEDHLPVELPDLADFAPSGTTDEHTDPEPPLARAVDWVDVELDLGDGPRRYRRETNTMPQWAGSCWYYLRYLDPTNDRVMVDPDVERYWMTSSGGPGGVDLYVGGVEHAVLHLLYARFWHKILYDLGHVSTAEPFQRLFNQGYVQAAAYLDERGFYVEASEVEERGDGYYYLGKPVTRQYGKMGKSLKNSVTPDEIISNYGADSLRLHEMFLGPLDQDRPWDTQAITGLVRFLQRVWRYVINEKTGEVRVGDVELTHDAQRALHRAIADVRRDLERLKLNTAIATLMELMNELRAADSGDVVPRKAAEWLVRALAPFAPHLCEELWERLGHDNSVVYAPYPEPDETLVAADTVTVAVQINGKLRTVTKVPAGSSNEILETVARHDARVAERLDGAVVKRVVVVPDQLVNFVLASD